MAHAAHAMATARAVLAAPLMLVALAAGCGASRPAGPPRSTCAEAAASIAQGLRVASPGDAERAADLEPRFANACRTSRWRPNVVRCFALARDPAEHRVCANRLEPAQREEAHVIQGALYATPNRARPDEELPDLGICPGLTVARDALLACPALPESTKLDYVRSLEVLARSIGRAAAASGPSGDGELAMICERMLHEVRRVLMNVGC